MKTKKFRSGRILTSLALAAAFSLPAFAEDLVILHTNDTHSNIEPDSRGVGGVLQRKAVVDSVRKAEKNVMLVDAGDMVQGSLYFRFFRGDVEYPLFNMFGYDIRILGNHEFDNGLQELARHYKDVKGARLSANYDFSGTPLKGMFQPYVIKNAGGRRIGFIGLNVDPESLISRENTEGLGFRPIISVADSLARMLKTRKKCDLVVAVSHIGYGPDAGRETDTDLARASRNIDVIIGGHSHTTVDPDDPGSVSHIVRNADGRPVLIAQTGKYGRNIGYIRINLDSLGKETPDDFEYRLIPVTDRFSDSCLDPKMKAFLKPYKAAVDSVNHHVIARSAMSMKNDDRNGALANFTADMAMDFGRHVADSLSAAGSPLRVDLSVMNVGGIRQDMPEGDVTEGQILSTYPFSNRMVITAQKGSDIIEAMRVAARKGGEAVSSNVRVVADGGGELVRVVIDGEEMDPEKTYNMVTIDYVAEGNDGMTSFSNGRILWRDSVEMVVPVMAYITKLTSLGLPIQPDPTGRFVREYGGPDR